MGIRNDGWIDYLRKRLDSDITIKQLRNKCTVLAIDVERWQNLWKEAMVENEKLRRENNNLRDSLIRAKAEKMIEVENADKGRVGGVSSDMQRTKSGRMLKGKL